MKTIHPTDITALWARMTATYGHRWTSSHGDKDFGNIWFEALRDLNIPQLWHGAVACVEGYDGWPPSAPEFRRMCLGIEERGEAVERALMGIDSTPVVARMVASVPAWDREHCGAADLRERYRAIYAIVVKDFEAEATGALALADDDGEGFDLPNGATTLLRPMTVTKSATR